MVDGSRSRTAANLAAPEHGGDNGSGIGRRGAPETAGARRKHVPRATQARRSLNGVPSIVIGVFAYGIAVLPFRQFSAMAGGVALNEIDPATMQSRVCPGLFLVGEILDVDGRIGGFNFQWAWSSARVAAAALAG